MDDVTTGGADNSASSDISTGNTADVVTGASSGLVSALLRTMSGESTETQNAGESAPSELTENSRDTTASATPTADEIATLRLQAALAEQFGPVLEALKSAGLSDAQVIQERLAAQEAQGRQQAAEDAAYVKIQERLQDLVDSDQITEEQAEAQLERELALVKRELAIQSVQARAAETETEATLTRLQAQYTSLADGDVRQAVSLIAKATGGPIDQVAKVLHEAIHRQSQAAVTKYATEQAKTRAVPTPQSSGIGGAATGTPTAPGQSGPRSWAERFGIQA